MGIHSRARPTIASLLVSSGYGYEKLHGSVVNFNLRIANLHSLSIYYRIMIFSITKLSFEKKHISDKNIA